MSRTFCTKADYRLRLTLARQVVDDLDKGLHAVLGPRGQFHLVNPLAGIPKGDLMTSGEAVDLFHGGRADSPRGDIDDTAHTQAIVGVQQDAQVGDQVFDLAPLVEPHPADDLVGNAVVDKLLFQRTRLTVGPVQHGEVGVAPVAGDTLVADDPDNGRRFFDFVGRFDQGDTLAFELLRPQPLVRPPPVVADDMVGGVKDVLGGAVILFEFDDGGVGESRARSSG